MTNTHSIAAISESATYWLHRELQLAGVAGTMAPKLVNPRTQSWLAGFLQALGQALALTPAQLYELEARTFVQLFAGSPMGEQLGLEALAMSKQMANLPGATAVREEWETYRRKGAAAGAHCAGLLSGLAEFAATLR